MNTPGPDPLVPLLRSALPGWLDALARQIPRVAAHDDDPEVYHKARVACRRLRSSLELVRGTLADGHGAPLRAAGLRRRLRDTARVLGCVRDADVARHRLAAMAVGAGPALGAALTHLDLVLGAQRSSGLLAAPQVLVVWEGPDGLDFNRERLAGVESRGACSAALIRRVRRVHLELEGSISSLGLGSPPERWHQARLRGKTLRYGLELIARLNPADPGPRCLQQLQELLGDLNDVRTLQELSWCHRRLLGRRGRDVLVRGGLGELADHLEVQAQALQTQVLALHESTLSAGIREDVERLIALLQVTGCSSCAPPPIPLNVSRPEDGPSSCP